MKLSISRNFLMTTDDNFLGYLGENNARKLDITFPNVAEQLNDDKEYTYHLFFEYNNGTVYDWLLSNIEKTEKGYKCALMIPNGYLLESGKARIQWAALSSGEGEEQVIAKSNIVQVVINNSLDTGDITPIPPMESINNLINSITEKLGGLTFAYMFESEYNNLTQIEEDKVYYVASDEGVSPGYLKIYLNNKTIEAGKGSNVELTAEDDDAGTVTLTIRGAENNG